jgi:uncharacterized membrane protein
MSLDPILSAPWQVQVHAAAAIVALVLGIVQMVAIKGTSQHRSIGYVWLTAMMVVATSSFFISSMRIIGPFGPIHILSVLTFINTPRAIWAARKGNIKAHRNAMLQLFWIALVGAGLFTLLPNRIMGQVVFGP